MIVGVLFPKIGLSAEEVTVIAWSVADGGKVIEGAMLYTFESDKSVQEIEGPASGILKIAATAGETYPVGASLATIA